MKCDAQERMFKLRKVAKIDGYKIMKGEKFSKAECVYQWIRSGARKL
jgi:hypothetical protein